MLALLYTAGSSVLLRVCSRFCEAVAVSSEPASSSYASIMTCWDPRLAGKKGFALLPPPQLVLRPEAGHTQCFIREVDIPRTSVK